MRWNDDARAAVEHAPFFVRGMIRRRVEEHVRKMGRDNITLEDVTELRNKALQSGEVTSQSKGEPLYDGMTADQIEKLVAKAQAQIVSDSRFYEVKVCGGAHGCPRSLFDVRDLADEMIDIIEQSGVADAIGQRVKGPVLRHHKLCVSISGCPNSCSQPQIVDFGVQSRARPTAGDGNCIDCGHCTSACKESSIQLTSNGPVFDHSLCIDCGDCASACPTGAIVTEEQGFSVLVGGKLGRHPQLARVLYDFTDRRTLLQSLKATCGIFAIGMQDGERFANTVDRLGVDEIRCMVHSCKIIGRD